MCFFLEPKGVSPNVTPPPKKEGDYYVLTTMIPLVRPYIGGLILDSESDVAAPFPALEKMNFLRVLFRYGVLNKKRVLLPTVLLEGIKQLRYTVYTSWSWNF